MEIVRYINEKTVIGAVPTVAVESPMMQAMLAALNRQRGLYDT